MTVWNFARVGLQAATLLLFVRVFGADGYGVLAGAVALYASAGLLAGLGSGIALVRHAARDRSILDERTRATRLTYLLTGLALLAVMFPLSMLVLPDLPVGLLLCLALAELVAAPAIQPTIYRFQAQERMGAFGACLAVAPFARLAAIVIAWILGLDTPERFGFIYLACLAIAAVACGVLDARPARDARWSQRSLLREGLPYSFSGAAAAASSELDKTIVLGELGARTAGVYSAPFRIVQAATMPAMALALAAVPRLFRSSVDGSRSRLPELLGAAAAYGVVAGAGLWLAAPLLAGILGADFADSAWILRALSVYLVANCLRQVVALALTTSDRQGLRNGIEIILAVVSVPATVFAARQFGLSGVIAAVTAIDVVFLASAASVVMAGRAKPKAQTAPD